jgi:thiol-disulfide isomerase/thioredoxin
MNDVISISDGWGSVMMNRLVNFGPALVSLCFCCGCGGDAQPTPGTSPSSRPVVDPLPTPDSARRQTVDRQPAEPTTDTLEPPAPPAAVLKDKAGKSDRKQSPAPSSTKAEVRLTVVDLAGYEKQLAQWKGSIIAVDVWATWCAPCVKKFPKFVELSHKHGPNGVVFVSLSADDQENADEALRFLKQQGATFANLLVKDELTAVQDRLGFEGIPRYLVYDASGQIVLRAAEVEELAPALAKLVK